MKIQDKPDCPVFQHDDETAEILQGKVPPVARGVVKCFTGADAAGEDILDERYGETLDGRPVEIFEGMAHMPWYAVLEPEDEETEA